MTQPIRELTRQEILENHKEMTVQKFMQLPVEQRQMFKGIVNQINQAKTVAEVVNLYRQVHQQSKS